MERIGEQQQQQPQPCIGGGSYTYQVSRHSAEMLSNLNRQRKSGGRFCDVLLRVGEESFPAHKAVLAACSEYFESVFSSQPDTGDNKELEMHTISSKVFRDILDFAYTSRIVVRLESFPELLTAAKFLLMRSIIDICQEVIKQSNVQILVPPPPARGDMMLFRAGAAATDLGFPLDMTNGAGLGGTGNSGAGMGHPQDGELPRAGGPPMATSSPSVMPSLQAVDRLPAVLPPPGSPQLAASSFHSVASSTSGGSSKRGRGRPRKMLGMDCMMFGNSSLPRETGVFPCGLCGKIFTDGTRLRHHEAQHGVTSLQLGFGDSQQNRLGDNGMPAMDETGIPRKRGRIRKQVGCEVCGKIFRDVYHLNRHKLSHSGEKPYSCPVCGLRFKRKDRMSYHVRSHDGSVGKPYVCQNCGKGFSRPDHLNGHIKQVHTTERPHKCQTCNASFATRDRLRSHLACHEEKIPCQVCGKYLRAAYMADHLKKHTEGPTNFCSICNRDDPKCPHQDQHDNSDSFGDLSDGSDLKSPDKLNQNGPYSCEALKSKPDPEAERKYQCPDCGSCFRSKSYLNKHIQKAHLKPMAGPLGDLGPTLGSPFSPQQNMSLLESFGFQIVQSAFASSLADPEMEQGPMSVDDK